MGWHIDFNFFEGGIKRGGIKKSGAIRKVLQSLLHPRMYRRSGEEGSFSLPYPTLFFCYRQGGIWEGQKTIIYVLLPLKLSIT